MFRHVKKDILKDLIYLKKKPLKKKQHLLFLLFVTITGCTLDIGIETTPSLNNPPKIDEGDFKNPFDPNEVMPSINITNYKVLQTSEYYKLDKDSTPNYVVQDLPSGAIVYLYSGPVCESLTDAQKSVSNANGDVYYKLTPHKKLTINGDYTYSLKITNNKNTSDCISLPPHKFTGQRNRIITDAIKTVYPGYTSFVLVTVDGKADAIGDIAKGGDTSKVVNELYDIVEVTTGSWAHAAIRKDGTVVTWGTEHSGGNSSSVKSKLYDIVKIYSTGQGFLAVRKDGTGVTWGQSHAHYGHEAELRGIKELYTNGTTHLIVREDRTGYVWGDIPANGVGAYIYPELTNINAVFAMTEGFFIHKDDGDVYSFGTNKFYTDHSSFRNNLGNTRKIYTNDTAYLAVKNTGEAIAWGSINGGHPNSTIKAKLTEIAEVFPVTLGFFAKKTDGSILAWGAGSIESATTPAVLQEIAGSVNVQYLGGSYFATKADGTTFGWGRPNAEIAAQQFSQFKHIIDHPSAGAAIKDDGTVVTWGDPLYGGDASSVQSELVDVIDIKTFSNSFIALTSSGKVIQWGFKDTLPYYNAVKDSLNNIKKIYTHSTAAMAINENGKATVWGVYNHGGIAEYRSLNDVADVVHGQNTAGSIMLDGSFQFSSREQTIFYIEQLTAGILSARAQNSPIVELYEGADLFTGRHQNNKVSYFGNGYDLTVPDSNLEFKSVFPSQGGMLIMGVTKDNEAKAWGLSMYLDVKTFAANLTDVTKIESSIYSVAALKEDKTVLSFGYSYYGGNNASVATELTGVKTILVSSNQQAALKENGTVVAWGDTTAGIAFNTVKASLVDVETIVTNGASFAALLKNGNVITWGTATSGGNSSAVNTELRNIKKISGTRNSFVALRDDGKLIAWGQNTSNAVLPQYENIADVLISKHFYYFVKSDGDIALWGYDQTLKNIRPNLLGYKKITQKDKLPPYLHYVDGSKKSLEEIFLDLQTTIHPYQNYSRCGEGGSNIKTGDFACYGTLSSQTFQHRAFGTDEFTGTVGTTIANANCASGSSRISKIYNLKTTNIYDLSFTDLATLSVRLKARPESFQLDQPQVYEWVCQ